MSPTQKSLAWISAQASSLQLANVGTKGLLTYQYKRMAMMEAQHPQLANLIQNMQPTCCQVSHVLNSLWKTKLNGKLSHHDGKSHAA